jgi:hypothetical protein
MMEQHELETVVKNIDQRVGRIEQIVPTLATKEDVRVAIAPLATRAEMHEALREEGERTRRHFDIVAEDLRSHIRLIAEGQIGLQQRMDDLRTDLKADIAQLDRRVMRLEATR